MHAEKTSSRKSMFSVGLTCLQDCFWKKLHQEQNLKGRERVNFGNFSIVSFPLPLLITFLSWRHQAVDLLIGPPVRRHEEQSHVLQHLEFHWPQSEKQQIISYCATSSSEEPSTFFFCMLRNAFRASWLHKPSFCSNIHRLSSHLVHHSKNLSLLRNFVAREFQYGHRTIKQTFYFHQWDGSRTSDSGLSGIGRKENLCIHNYCKRLAVLVMRYKSHSSWWCWVHVHKVLRSAASAFPFS